MGFTIFAALFGLAIAGAVVQVTVLRRTSFSFPTVVVSGSVAVLFVFVIATIVGYFMARVRINDHYEVDSVLMAIVVVGPATAGALIGAVAGGLAGRYLLADRW